MDATPAPPRRSCRRNIVLPAEIKKSVCFLFLFVVLLHLQHTKAPVRQRAAKNPTLMSEEKRRVDPQPVAAVRLSRPAAPTGVLPVCKR